MKIYKFLENPFWYRLIIRLFSVISSPAYIRSEANFLEKMFSQEGKGVLLEVGCGTCKFNGLYEKHVPQYFATDINFDYLKYAKKMTKNAVFTVSDSQLLPFRPYSFDSIFALFMFHHLPDESVQATLQQLDLCLKDEGKLVVMDVFLPDNYFNLPALIAGKIDRGRHVRKRSHFLNFCTRKKIFKWQEIDFKESWPYDVSAFILHKSRTHE